MAEKKIGMAQYPDSISSTILNPEKNLVEILQETTAKYPANNALSFYGRKITYQQLLGLSQGFTSALQQNQVQKGERVALMLPNCPQYVISYYGTLGAGAIVTQVNPMNIPRGSDHVCGHYQSSSC
jgi:long-chain acyl-CoA synthetase